MSGEDGLVGHDQDSTPQEVELEAELREEILSERHEGSAEERRKKPFFLLEV